MNLKTIFLLSFSMLHCQTKGEWVLMEHEPTATLSFSKTQNLELDDYIFKAIWNDSLSYSDNLGYVGGIGELQVFKDKKQIQTLHNIKDGIALGNIKLTFYDYNMDGYVDFSIPIDCGRSCHDSYYLFNPETETFQHNKKWDYLRIQKLNQITKQILTVPEGTAQAGEQILYQLNGHQLLQLKVIKY